MAVSIIGLFDSANAAQQASTDLAREGFDRSSISTSTSPSDLDRFGMSSQDSDLYRSALRRGGYLLFIRTDEAQSQRVQTILDRNGAIDIDSAAEGLRTASPDTTLQVLREQLNVGKREVQTGGVRIRSYITEEPVSEQVQLREEHVDVQRRPVNQPTNANLIDDFEEKTFEVRETSEVPVVNKEARIIEEVAINKTNDQRTETVQDSVRHTHVDVEPVAGEAESGWREDLRRRFGNDPNWESYRPAYEFGYSYRSRPEYSSVDWSTAEPRLRQEWERSNPGTWDRNREAIRSSYDYDRASSGLSGRAYADNPTDDARTGDTRGFFEKVADAITGDNTDDKTGRRVD